MSHLLHEELCLSFYCECKTYIDQCAHVHITLQNLHSFSEKKNFFLFFFFKDSFFSPKIAIMLLRKLNLERRLCESESGFSLRSIDILCSRTMIV